MTPKPQKKLPKNWGKIKVGKKLVNFGTLAKAHWGDHMFINKATLHQDALELMQQVCDLTYYGTEILPDDEWRAKQELIELCGEMAKTKWIDREGNTQPGKLKARIVEFKKF